MTKYKKGKISSFQFFSILFVSRIVVTLTYIKNVSVGKLSTDLLISIFLGLIGIILFSIPICLCIKKNKNPFDIKWVAVLYSLFFIFNSSLNIIRFSYFATSRFNAPLSITLYILIVIAAALYAARLGIEPLGRFGVLCAASLLFVMSVVVAFNLKNVDLINLYPIVDNSKIDILENAAMISAHTIEPTILLALYGKVNGSTIKPMMLGFVSSFAVIFVFIFMCMCVMGSSATLQSYPIFTLFQMASIGTLSRLDMLHTAFWMMALFLKTAVFIYASSGCIDKYSHKTKTIVSALLTFLVSVVIVSFVSIKTADIITVVSLCSSVVFLLIIPIASLFRKGKVNSVENV